MDIQWLVMGIFYVVIVIDRLVVPFLSSKTAAKDMVALSVGVHVEEGGRKIGNHLLRCQRG